jgi:hypothetical protein
MKRKPGRPHAARPKDVRITVRFTEDEMRRIDDACLHTKDTYAEFIRRCVHAYPPYIHATARPAPTRQVTVHSVQPLAEPTERTIRSAQRAARRVAQHPQPAMERAIASGMGPEEELAIDTTGQSPQQERS